MTKELSLRNNCRLQSINSGNTKIYTYINIDENFQVKNLKFFIFSRQNKNCVSSFSYL